MMVFPEAIITEYNISGSMWVDISAYVVTDIECNGGFDTSDPTDFTAGLGISKFDLDNSGGLFTVYGGDSVRGLNTLAGWNRGTKIRHRVKYLHYDEEVWVGFVQDVESDDGIWGDERVHVTCLDWIDTASRYPMKRTQIQTNKTLGEGVQSIVDRIAKAPEGVITDTYSTTFPAIFNNVRGKTKAIGEIDKLARSEPGYVYVLKDGYLKVEGATSRTGAATLTQVPASPDNALMVAIGNALLVSADNVLLIDGSKAAELTVTSEKLDLKMADEYWNDAYIRSYPTSVGNTLEVLHSIGSPITLAQGVPLEFIGNYSDPNGGAPINGTNMQSLVTGTDVQAFDHSDGSGAELTNYLTFTPDFYGDVVVHRLVSSFPSGPTFITRLQARGNAIRRNSYLERHVYITGSAEAYGDKAFELLQTYRTEPYTGALYGASILEQYKTPKTRVVGARYCANLNSDHMLAFLHLDIGSLIKVYDNRSQMFKWHYITSRKLLLALGGIILFSYGLREHLSIASGGLNDVAVDFSGRATGDGIDFGYLPDVAGDDVTSFSISARIYLRSVWTSFTTITNIYTEGGANSYFYLQGTSGATKLSFQTFRYTNTGRWSIPDNALATGTWSHIVLTYNLDVSADPLIYVDGVSQTITEEATPSGDLRSAVGARLVIGNTGQFLNGVDAILKDFRFYKNRILTPSEVLTLSNGGVVDTSLMTDGLVVQGLAINSDLGTATSLNNQPLPIGDKFFENVLRRVGEVHGTPLVVNQ